MGRLFGTDGVRGVANTELTAEIAYRLGRAGAYVLTRGKQNAKLIVGKDTRISGDMLEAALLAGILSVGVDAVRVGVISTPGVAYLTRALQADAGVMISASHNPVADNGIKFFGGDGFKLLDQTEDEIESLLQGEDQMPRPIAGDIGRVAERLDGISLYADYLQTTVDNRFEGLKVVLDCGNGAAYQVAPQVFRQLGAEVVVVHAEPNGVNINVKCGSTYPEVVREAVLAHKADVGLSFDGDADRLIAVDEKGQLVDGDYIMAILGRSLKASGELAHDTVVTTVMSNVGFVKAAKEMGIQLVRTAVGDRYVMEAMRKGGYQLGGEQSGHIILLKHNTTGDGILSAVQLVNAMVAEAKPLSELRSVMQSFPQALVNVRVGSKDGWEQNKAIQQVIREVEAEMGDDGRVLVRPSGTEPLIRVMAEGPNEQTVQEYVDRIANVVRKELGK
ncbi:phosphoglucosamine mutase [Effusibacillus dendaii]|uniref:Phosphoglucosamine mutase n=1 Tax=Effusibacillus dendaii TaxID=2743772 RepID=A0A7I8DB09_9BACL|nr:phosphoglucosamine mutase [Effusibacillus dendaii]BCJ87285.1 phosphoglucosamine mutase [Effusibacillus dendaii]